jgi:hypothetical protein
MIAQITYKEYEELTVINGNNIAEFVNLLKKEDIEWIELISGSYDEFKELLTSIEPKNTKKVQRALDVDLELMEAEDFLNNSTDLRTTNTANKLILKTTKKLEDITNSMKARELMSFCDLCGGDVVDYLNVTIY